MQKIGIIVAMQKELDLFTQSLTNLKAQKIGNRTIYCGNFANKDLYVALSGIGKVNSALCAADLINYAQPDIILNIGISGGLDSSLSIGEFIVGSQILYHDVWCGEPNEYGQIQGMPAMYQSQVELVTSLSRYRHGLICSGDKFITDTEELQTIKKQFPTALAVDMESASIAQTCYIYNTPLLCVRQISDTPGEHQAEQYSAFWQQAPQNSVSAIIEILNTL